MATDTRAPAVLGAIVADAASLGLHWLYDPARIADVTVDTAGPAFVPIDAAHFDGVPGYFAHGARADGQVSQYGECLLLALHTYAAGGFDVAAYQDAFAARFGPGGDYVGYIDRPTRGTLANLAADVKAPSGIDDDQLPAIARLPAVVAYGTDDDIMPAIQITNVNDVATAYGQVFARLLHAVIAGAPVVAALKTGAADAPSDIRAPLVAALEADEPDSVAYGEITQRACHLPMAMPLAFHIMARAGSYRDAVERNINAGGDSCGRAMIIGAVMGAAHGIEGRGIPLEWIMRTDDASDAWSMCRKIEAMSAP